jgi:ATP-dependent HslUV protease ATP-binding subunit HslU
VDKIAGRIGPGSDVSRREGVQRDILPIIEGTTINTRYGMVRTDHILFVAAGAFHVSKPRPDSRRCKAVSHPRGARGRLAWKTSSGFRNRRTPWSTIHGAARYRGHQADLHQRGRARDHNYAARVNENAENIGARRRTPSWRSCWMISFEGPDLKKTDRASMPITSASNWLYCQDQDLSRYIL